MSEYPAGWFAQRAAVIAGILLFGLVLAVFVRTVSLPVVPSLLQSVVADTVRFTALVTTILYAITEGTG